MLNLTSPLRADPLGDPGTVEVRDPVAALAALASPSAGSATRILMLRRQIHYGVTGHIQGLTHLGSSRGERCLALCASAAPEGELAFAAVVNHGNPSFRRAAPVAGMGHPSGMGAFRDVLALACEDDTRPACLRVYRDPVEAVQVAHVDRLVFDGSHGEPTGRARSKAAWLAWTRLVDGRYFALVGGHDFGRDHGWAVLYDPRAPRPFSIPAAYAASTYQGPRVVFQGARFGAVNSASFVTGSDGTIYLITVETQNHQFGYGLFKLFRVEPGAPATPVVLRFLAQQRVYSRGNASFRFGSCVFVNGGGGFTAVCSERGSGLNVTLYEVGA